MASKTVVTIIVRLSASGTVSSPFSGTQADEATMRWRLLRSPTATRRNGETSFLHRLEALRGSSAPCGCPRPPLLTTFPRLKTDLTLLALLTGLQQGWDRTRSPRCSTERPRPCTGGGNRPVDRFPGLAV